MSKQPDRLHPKINPIGQRRSFRYPQGPNGEVYLLATDFTRFWLNRSTNATNRATPFHFDLTVPVDLGGTMVQNTGPNPAGLLGQAWVAVDHSTNQTRGNVYALCSTAGSSNTCDVMFARSITAASSGWAACSGIASSKASSRD